MTQGATLDTVLIGGAAKRPRAVVAALMAAAQTAIAAVAEGACWEGDETIAIPRRAADHAREMADIWRRAADRLQAGGDLSGAGSPATGGPDRSALDRLPGQSLQH